MIGKVADFLAPATSLALRQLSLLCMMKHALLSQDSVGGLSPARFELFLNVFVRRPAPTRRRAKRRAR